MKFDSLAPTMTVESLLTSVAEKGVELWLEGNRLRFRAPDGALTPELREQLAGRRADVIDALRRRRRESVRLESPADGQSALWFVNQTAPDSAAYNIAFAARILSPVDKHGLKEALQTLVDRHGELRATFASDRDNLVRRIPGYVDAVLTEHDVGNLSAEEVDQAVEREHRKPFDLSQGPLFRSSLFSKGESDHVLLMVVHHIICDGWSLIVLVDELRSILKQQNGEASPLDELRTDYDAFVEWQRHFLASTEGRKQRDYWMSRLAGDLPLLDLAPDGQRPMTEESHGRSISFQITPEVSGAINRVARANSTTNYVVLLAAYQILLSRFSGQDEVLVGSPAFGRSRPDFGRVVGDFINMVTLRGKIAGDRPFTEYLTVTRGAVLEALDNQDYPFSRIVEALGGRRHRTHSPVFQATFTYQGFDQLPEIQELMMTNGRQTPVSFGALDLMPYVLTQQEGQFDYSLEMTDKDGRLRGSLRFMTSIMSTASAKRMVDAYVHLLAEITRRPDAVIDEIGMLSPDSRREVLDLSKSKAHRRAGGASALSRFATQCRERPDALAVRCGEVKLSYADLDRRSTELARYLVSLGLPNDSLVGLYLRRSEELLVGVLGVMKAGAAYLPLDPAFPQERLGYMLEDSGASLVLTESVLAGSLPDKEVRSVCLDGAEIAEAAGDKALPEPDPESRAYVIYTSGSTGKPKGVEVTHRNLANFLSSMAVEPGLTAADVLCAVTTLSFDISMLELLLPLTVGASVVLADRETTSDGRRLAALLAAHEVTVMQATPATWRLLIDSGWRGGEDFRVLCGGEPLPPDLLGELQRRAGEVWNMYGPTETTIWSTCCRLERGDAVHIGRPIANTAVYVVDGRGELQPVGVPGEIWIGGEGVARGYLNRPELTAERFLADPFQGEGRLYRTGDQGRWRADGTLQHLGRLDEQVKVRGFRIELGEIETRLCELAGIERAVVSVWQPAEGDQRLVAYYLGGEALTAADMRGHLQRSLPDYMIPQFFVQIEALPLTPNGKIDRKSLPPPLADEGGALVYTAPRTDTERQLAEIWEELLGVKAIGAHDNFFERGGHSLLAARAIGRLNGRFQVELPLRTLFEASVLSDLAAKIDTAIEAVSAASPGDPGRIPLVRVSRTGELPLSHAQRRLWFLDQLEPGGSAYVIPSASVIHGDLDVRVLERCLTEILRRHEILRTVFETTEGYPSVAIREPSAVAVPLIDISGLSATEREDRVNRLLADHAGQPFDLATGPLLSVGLYRLSATDHLLLLAFHHIVFDFWSAGIFVDELTRLYSSFKSGRPSPLAELPIQFLDYAHWQARSLDDGGREKHLLYWKQQLGGDLATLNLPVDRPRSKQLTVRGAKCSLQVDRELSAALAALSQQQNVTPAMTLLAAFQVLLHRLSGQDRLQVGMPVAGRDRPETENLIGFFVNTVVIRSDLPGPLTFRAFLQQVREAALGAYEHQDMPFEELVAALDPERDLNRTPLFQAFFNHINMAIPALKIPGATVEPLMQFDLESKFELTLYAQEQDDRLNLMLVYDAELFDVERMEDFLAQYALLLQQICRDPEHRVGAYSLVPGQAAGRLPDPGRPLTPCAEYTSRTLDVRHIAAYGERVALAGPTAEWSYRQLDERADRLAAILVNAGIQRGDVIALYAQRDPMLVCAILGVLRAGAAFAILDHAYPDARLAENFKAAGPRGLLVVGDCPEPGAALEEAIRAADPAIWLHLSDAVFDGEAATGVRAQLPEPGPDDIAYVAFTSGTTGGAKAIVGTHAPVAHFLDWQKDRFGLHEKDRFSLLSGLSHDPLLRDVFAPLWSGASLRIPESDAIRDPVRLTRWMRAEEVSVAHITPAMAGLLTMEGAARRLDALRYAFFGGDVLRGETVSRLRELSAELHCVNFYGTTETPQAMSYCSLPPGQAELRERVPIGHGIDGVQLLVLNSEQMLAGTGEVGDIVVRTPFLTRGYRGDETLTKQRFTANPFTDASDDRVYRTGDLGRYLPDGAVEIIGRSDSQVQVRGFRVELGAIEAAVRRHAAIRECAVVLREDMPGGPRLAAYLVVADATADDDATAAQLRLHLQRSLPDYMVPQYFVQLDALPLTPNGKLDVRSLPAPQEDEAEAIRYSAPRTQTERQLADIWQELLGIEAVGRDDDFFQRGGHSLLAARVVARLNSRFEVELPLRTFFEAPTPAELGVHLDRLLQNRDGTEYQKIERRQSELPAPLSFAQERLWYLHQLAPDSAAYNLSGALDLRGNLDEHALEAALQALAGRHEAFRTCIAMVDGWPTQQILEVSRLETAIVDVPFGTSDADLRDLIVAQVRQPFDLDTGPLFRTMLYKLTPERNVLLVICHHIVADGWSMGVFVRELGELYRQFAQGGEADLPSLPIRYTDYAAWQRAWLQGERLEKQLAYWREQLAGAPSYIEIPTDRTRPPQFTYRGARYGFRLPAALRDGLQRLSRREGVTLFMLLLASFQLLLSRYSNQRDVLVGSPVANRFHAELEGMIGLFVNTLVLRTEFTNTLSFRELLSRVRDTCLGAYGHQQLPFEKLVESLSPVRDLSRNPVFQVMFALQNMELPSLELGDVTVDPYPLERGGAQMDLTLYMWETGAGMQATFEYSTDLFDESTIERMAGHFLNLLQGAVDRPDANIYRLPLLSDVSRRQLLTERHGRTFEASARDETVLSLFAAGAARAPEAIAAECDGVQLSYAELDRRSNRIAAHLQSFGIAAGSLVGLCIPRGLDMLAGLFGILKAGAAYLPLDPDFPLERLRFMLQDSGAEVLVSTSSVAQDVTGDLPVRRVDLDTDRPLLDRCSDEGLGLTLQGDDLAYIIYTSGSTGRPKGVEIEHRALANFLRSMAGEPGLGENDVLMAVTTLSFDISILELFLPLSVGARVVIASRETVADGQHLMALLSECGATIMQATPATWRMLIDSDWEGNEGLKALCGGEALLPDLAAALLQRCGEVWNMYGPTETTIWSTCARLGSATSVHIGRPIANTRIYILNDELEPQPEGVPGQLFIGGEGVARGYHNRPDLTGERFLPNPFSGQGRIYATGDLARWRSDGNIEHLGRIDNQVKVRGYRIELGEIESCLAEHPHVKQCAVALREIRPGDQRLVACYVANDNVQTTVTLLRSHLKASLPSYMIPQHFVELSALPLTPNGKIDRNALPVAGGPAQEEDRYAPPKTEAEKRLADMWQELLTAERVGVHDNFFDLGGHSLLAARLVNQMNERLGVRVTLQSLTSDTLGQIASAMGGELAERAIPAEATTPARRTWLGGSKGGFLKRILGR